MTFADAKQKAQHLANVSGETTLVYRTVLSQGGYNFGFHVPIWGTPIIGGPRLSPEYVASKEGD